LTQTQQVSHIAALERHHGDYSSGLHALDERIATTSSRRFGLELRADRLTHGHRTVGVSDADLRELYTAAAAVGHRYGQVIALGIFAETHVFDADRFEECIQELEDLNATRFQPYRSLPHALAMRALATGDLSYASRAHEIASRVHYRSSAWISFEILMEHLGHPLSDVGTQWLEQYEDVRQRWLDIMLKIVDVASNG
jgi:hypothetical protein